VLRDGGKLAEAREQFLVCARPQCPGMVKSDCAGWLEATDKNMPTVVIRARDPAGVDIVDVRVQVDGVPLTLSAAGLAVPVNPGSRLFRFQLADGTQADRTVVVGEGQKNVVVEVVLGKIAGGGVAPPPSGGTPAPAHPFRLLGAVVGGAGVVSVGLGATFGALAASAWSSAKSQCGSNLKACNDSHFGQASSDQSSATTQAWVSTITFIAGGALIAGGGILFFTGGGSSHESSTASRTAASGPVLSPLFGPGQAGLALSGRF
jgi:hypothetical protein